MSKRSGDPDSIRALMPSSKKRPQPARRIRGFLLEMAFQRIRINPLKADNLRCEPNRLNRVSFSPGGAGSFRPYFLSELHRSDRSCHDHTIPPLFTGGRRRRARMRQHDEYPAPRNAELVEPSASGSVAMFGERAGGANLAGLIWGEELSEATGDRRDAGLSVNVADRYQPGADAGAPPPRDADVRAGAVVRPAPR